MKRNQIGSLRCHAPPARAHDLGQTIPVPRRDVIQRPPHTVNADITAVEHGDHRLRAPDQLLDPPLELLREQLHAAYLVDTDHVVATSGVIQGRKSQGLEARNVDAVSPDPEARRDLDPRQKSSLTCGEIHDAEADPEPSAPYLGRRYSANGEPEPSEPLDAPEEDGRFP